MPEDLKVSQIGSSHLPPPFRGLHSPAVKKKKKKKKSNYLSLLFPEIVYSQAVLCQSIACFLTFHVFGSCFRTLAVILVADFCGHYNYDVVGKVVP